MEMDRKPAHIVGTESEVTVTEAILSSFIFSIKTA